MNRIVLSAALAALAASPAAAQARAAVTASATVVAPLDTRAPAPAWPRVDADPRAAPVAPAPRDGAPAMTVTLPDGLRCTGASPAGGPVRLTCRGAAPRRARAVVLLAS